MLTQTFFKLFPPPKFLNIPHAGLDICDDAIRCVEYSYGKRGMILHKYGMKPLPPGIIESGTIKNPEELTKIIAELCHELKVTIVNCSLPEEKMYLFKAEVPNTKESEIRQNIEFKLEENVPLAPADAVFFFDLIPEKASDGNTMASVSVAPLELVNSYLDVLKKAGLTVLSFEIQAKAIAHALIARDSQETQVIVHMMERKTGIYVVCGRVVCFTSTISMGNATIIEAKDKIAIALEFQKEIQRVYQYWIQHGWGAPIARIILSGRGSLADGFASHCSPDPKTPVEIGRVWQNAFSTNTYLPPIPFEDSLDYAIAAGLAMQA